MMRVLVPRCADRLSAFARQCADRPAPGASRLVAFSGEVPRRSESRPPRPVDDGKRAWRLRRLSVAVWRDGGQLPSENSSERMDDRLETTLNYFYGRPARFFSVDGGRYSNAYTGFGDGPIVWWRCVADGLDRAWAAATHLRSGRISPMCRRWSCEATLMAEIFSILR